MLTAAAVEVENANNAVDEAFKEGDDIHLAEIGLVAEIQADLGLGSASVDFEVSSANDRKDDKDADTDLE